MPNSDDIRWFKQQFGAAIEAALQGTPYTLDMLTAIACQETGEVWPILRHVTPALSPERILELCVGDTLDADKGRGAFPKNREELLSKPNGAEMFGIARQALVDMAQYIKGYRGAAKLPRKFCHGFGVFQYDIQAFLRDPDFFLQKRYANMSDCLDKCIGELREKQNNVNNLSHLKGKTTLSDMEMAQLAIAYNSGGYNPKKGLMQGYQDDAGKFYGVAFFEYLRMAHNAAAPVAAPADGVVTTASGETAPASSGPALVAAPTPVEATGKVYEVDTKFDPLNLREQPSKTATIKAKLPDGHLVQAVSNKNVSGFLEVETSILGAHYQGFAWADNLKPAKGVETVPVPAPATAPTGPLTAVYMPRKAGTVTRRVDLAGPHSLNEPNQPSGRKGTTPDELRAELNAIVEWLAVDKQANKRYWPRDGITFCNIYAHDYCYLAGVYLPRVWWSQAAIEKLAQGQTVQPLYGNTIDEIRANGLFHWLRDFGLRFGWRRTGELEKLQQEVNLGAIGLIVARRTNEGKPGHIVAVVPESNDLTARRSAQGQMLAPVQSQAGVSNYRRTVSTGQWWLGSQFAEHAFWVHA